MRFASFAVTTFLLLGACGSAPPSQTKIIGSSPAAANDLVMLALPSVSGAQAAAIMHERHEGMESMGKAFKVLHRSMDPASPDLAATRAAAGDIAKYAKASSSWFPAGTGPDVGKTGAKPDIWKNPQDFSAKLASFQSAAQKFYAAAVAGDPARLKASGDDLAGTCKACHDKYRTEMHH